MFDIYLFDLDGTITDPGEGITNSVMYALKKYGIIETDRTALYKFIGPPLYESFEKYYGFSHEQAIEAVEFYREYYKDTGIFENLVYSGVEDMLSTLKARGKTVVLATSKPEIFAKRILEHFTLAKYFDFVAGATLDGSLINKADIIAYTLDTLNITDKSRCVMIGDRLHDIEGAKQNGIFSVGVTYGYGSFEELSNAEADRIVDAPSDILKLSVY